MKRCWKSLQEGENPKHMVKILKEWKSWKFSNNSEKKGKYGENPKKAIKILKGALTFYEECENPEKMVKILKRGWKSWKDSENPKTTVKILKPW